VVLDGLRDLLASARDRQRFGEGDGRHRGGHWCSGR
jgi:hypothetical protein